MSAAKSVLRVNCQLLVLYNYRVQNGARELKVKEQLEPLFSRRQLVFSCAAAQARSRQFSYAPTETFPAAPRFPGHRLVLPEGSLAATGTEILPCPHSHIPAKAAEGPTSARAALALRGSVRVVLVTEGAEKGLWNHCPWHCKQIA